jgi:3-phenylpropionate/trans-cinnamate dioxygenase ferredoxin component
MGPFERVARSDAVVQRTFLRVIADGRPVLLSRTADGTVVAFGPICPHQKKEMDEGTMWEDEVDCPHHHYTYDPRTGRNCFPTRVFPEVRARQVRGIPVFEVREEDGWVLVGPRKPPPAGVELDE